MNHPDRVIELDFRPRTYFWPHGLEKALLALVMGTVWRRELQALLAADKFDEIPPWLACAALPPEVRAAAGRIHPAFMGGEYLPDLAEQEVEIARIQIDSTTFDVTSVYARRGELPGTIDYRIVDEYGGDTLSEPNTLTSAGPLSLGELVEFFQGGWPLLDVLEMNFEGDLEGKLGFFRGSSDFYPQFDRCLREVVVEACGAGPDDLSGE
jgi:hypothetical protein